MRRDIHLHNSIGRLRQSPGAPWTSVFPNLEKESRADLPDARVPRAGHLAELTAAEIPIRIGELRVIEDVEEFGAYLERHGFFDHSSFREA